MEYATSTSPSGITHLYTYDRNLAQRVIAWLGDDYLEGVLTEAIGDAELWAVKYGQIAENGALDAALVTWNAVRVDVLPLPASVLAEIDEAVGRHPAGSALEADAVSELPVAEIRITPALCPDCSRVTRLSLAASIAGLTCALIALVAVLVALP